MKKPFNILVITPFFYPHWGGTERYILELYKLLTKKYKNIHVDVLTYDTDNTGRYREIYQNLTIYRVPAWNIISGQFALPNYYHLIRLLQQLKRGQHYRVLNSHTRFFDNSWWSPLAAKYLGAKSILTDHCANHPIHENMMVRRVAMWVDRLMIPRMTMMYDKVIATSQATKRFLVRHGAPAMDVVANGITLTHRLIKREHVHERHLRVTYVGRMIPSKGPQLALELANRLSRTNPRLTFTFVGDGPMLRSLQDMSASSAINFTGVKSRDEVSRILRQTDIFLYPSTHHDGLPSVLLEAGDAGCSVVATDTGAVTNLIKHEVTGLLAQPTVASFEKQVTKLIKSEKLRKRLGNNLNELVVREYDWDNIVETYYLILVSLV